MLEEAIQVAREMAQLGWCEAGAGNASVRVGEEVLITRSGARLGELKPEDFVPMDSPEASSESPTHRAIYEAFPEVKAVLHAHPPHLVAFSLATLDPDEIFRVYTEAKFVIPKGLSIVSAEPGSDELARKTVEALRHSDVVLWQAHGALAVGKTPREALDKLLVAEKGAQIRLLVGDRALGEGDFGEEDEDFLVKCLAAVASGNTLSEDELRKAQELAEALVQGGIDGVKEAGETVERMKDALLKALEEGNPDAIQELYDQTVDALLNLSRLKTRFILGVAAKGVVRLLNERRSKAG